MSKKVPSIYDQYSKIWADGNSGFGRHSYNDAKSAGISDKQLQKALQGKRIGKVAQSNILAGLGASPMFSKYARIWDDDRLGFGKESYEAAINQGVTNRQLQIGLAGSRIGRLANERITLGADAEFVRPAPGQQPPHADSKPDPKTLYSEGSAVGGSALGVKIKRSSNSKNKNNKNNKGTQSLNRSSRFLGTYKLKINNLNLA